MKKGVYLLIGIFALMLLFTNFVSAVCYGSNTASCTASTYSTCNAIDGCQWNDNSYCEGPEECLGIPYEPACTNPCIWYENAYCSKLSCSSLYSSQCDDAPGCTWVDGNGEFALADASSGASDYCQDLSIGTTHNTYTHVDPKWVGPLVPQTWSKPTLSSGTFTYGGEPLPFISWILYLITLNHNIVINGPAKSGDSTSIAFFRNPVGIRHSEHYNVISSSYEDFIHISHDDWNNICSADNQILYYYSYIYLDTTSSIGFSMYADDEGWVNFYHLNPGTDELIPAYGFSTYWGWNGPPEPSLHGIVGGNYNFPSGWYLIKIALQENGGEQELVVTSNLFKPNLGYLGWDGSEVVETCDRLAGSAFDRTDCDDYPVRNVCTYSDYDWHPAFNSYPNGCCGDDGASDVGVSYGDYTCTQCSATVSGVGDAGDYVWVISEICDNEIDDDCDGLIDCSDTNDCLSALPTDPCYTCEPACTGKECGDDSCGGTCPPGCNLELGETCVDGICQITGEPVAYWADENGYPLDISQTNYIYYVGDKIKLVVMGLDSGIEAVFEIYEDDSPLAPAEIRVGGSALPTTTVNSEGVAIVDWVISSLDVQEALQRGNDGDGDPSELYFKVNDNLESEQLITELKEFMDDCEGITLCEHYTETQCNPDSCDVNAASVPDDIDCELEGYNCRCEYDDIEGCQATWDGIEDNPENPEGPPITIGTCTYLTDDSIDPLGCEDDDYLSYGWEGVWTWASGNEITQYDPNDKQAQCETEGVSWVACPAQIELPFFGTWGIIVTIALIVLIYIALGLRKHKPKKRKKK